MADGTIIIQNLTDANNVQYWVAGVGSGTPTLCSGQLGTEASGVQQETCQVSGYDNYLVAIGPIGTSPTTEATVQVEVGSVVSLGTSVS